MKTGSIKFALMTLLLAVVALSYPSNAFGAFPYIGMFRLFNPYNGEHLYTSSSSECNALVADGWKYEGIGWVAPTKSKTPVFRLYNRYSGDHHYTTSSNERDSMVRNGWEYEGIGWYSDDSQTVPVYREFNPYVTIGTHNFTTSKSEHEKLGAIGWHLEDVGWYAVRAGVSSTTNIMGKPQSSVAKMVALYRSTGQQYPTKELTKGGAPDIESFCSIVYNQAISEGVRPEVVFSQAMVETGPPRHVVCKRQAGRHPPRTAHRCQTGRCPSGTAHRCQAGGATRPAPGPPRASGPRLPPRASTMRARATA